MNQFSQRHSEAPPRRLRLILTTKSETMERKVWCRSNDVSLVNVNPFHPEEFALKVCLAVFSPSRATLPPLANRQILARMRHLSPESQKKFEQQLRCASPADLL